MQGVVLAAGLTIALLDNLRSVLRDPEEQYNFMVEQPDVDFHDVRVFPKERERYRRIWSHAPRNTRNYQHHITASGNVLREEFI